jgi:hypothetical protein
MPRWLTITVHQGVLDTDMQAHARSQPPNVLPSVELFKGFHRECRLVAPAVVASKIVGRLVVRMSSMAAPTAIRSFEGVCPARGSSDATPVLNWRPDRAGVRTKLSVLGPRLEHMFYISA